MRDREKPELKEDYYSQIMKENKLASKLKAEITEAMKGKQ